MSSRYYGIKSQIFIQIMFPFNTLNFYLTLKTNAIKQVIKNQEILK